MHLSKKNYIISLWYLYLAVCIKVELWASKRKDKVQKPIMKKDGRGFKCIFKHLKDLRKKTTIQATTGKTRNNAFSHQGAYLD